MPRNLMAALTEGNVVNQQVTSSCCTRIHADQLGLTGIPEVDEAAIELRNALDAFDAAVERARVAIDRAIEEIYAKE